MNCGRGWPWQSRERATHQGGETLLFLTDEQLRQGIEAMFFAYRGFTADPDRILRGMAYGRAHHRAMHFIHCAPGTTVNNLLAILGVTKQSLNRVLRTLIEDGLVESRVGPHGQARTPPVPDRSRAGAGAAAVRCAARAHAGGLSRRPGPRPWRGSAGFWRR